jgi:DNA-binding transcriptional ArsR family regulator
MTAPWLKPLPIAPDPEPVPAETPSPAFIWWKVLNAFVDRTLAKIKQTDAVVWLVLFRNSTGGNVTISQARIATLTGLGLRTVEGAIRRLKQAGLVRVERRGNNLKGIGSTYRLRGRIREVEAGENRCAYPHVGADCTY